MLESSIPLGILPMPPISWTGLAIDTFPSWAMALFPPEGNGLSEKLCLNWISKSLHLTCMKGSLGGETSVLQTFRMSGKELVKERVSEGKS